MRFRPCIDLHQGKVKQIVGSTLSDTPGPGPITNFETDRSPADFARMYRRDGLEGGHVIMLGPGNDAAAREAVAAYPGGLQVGGGITPHTAPAFIDAGASHVIITSYVFENGHVAEAKLREACQSVGRDRLVLDLSCRKRGGRYYVVADRWQTFTDTVVEGAALEWLGRYCGEFLVHAVDVEGRRCGVDEELIKLLADECPIGVTYAGGIASLEDLERVRTTGRGRVDATVGSALDIFGGRLPYGDVVQWYRVHSGEDRPRGV